MAVHRVPLPSDVHPMDLLSARLPEGLLRSGSGVRLFWSAPDSGVTIAGLGCVEEISSERLGDVARGMGADGLCDQDPAPTMEAAARSAFGRSSLHEGVPAFVALPFATGGPPGGSKIDLRWHGLDGVRVIVPEVCFYRAPERGWCTTAWPREPRGRLRDRAEQILELALATSAQVYTVPNAGQSAPVTLAEPERTALRDRVANCVSAIRAGQADKVVLATSHTLTPVRSTDALSVLQRHTADSSETCRFLVQRTPSRAWVGASPERLVAVSGSEARTVALAGSAPRDADPDADAVIGEALLSSAKDRAEHQWVVDSIAESLRPLATEITIPHAPRLKRLAAIQHLETPIEARLKRHEHLLDLAGLLQPTPALGGSPRDAALELIDALEPVDRGWYGGAIGWVDADGDGDLTVAIRSMLIHGANVTAFAGAGVVADSDPDAEVREIELKLGSVLRHA